MKKLMRSILCLSMLVSLFEIANADELKYNPFSNEWSYERPNTSLKYNPFENRWEWAE